jgi:hypothetical protein
VVNENEYKLEIYIPETHLETVSAALHEAGAGRIGNYDHCLSATPVRGYWRPLEGSDPFAGEPGEITEGSEYKVEVRCNGWCVRDALAAVRRVHPYEEPLINVIELANRLFDSEQSLA